MSSFKTLNHTAQPWNWKAGETDKCKFLFLEGKNKELVMTVLPVESGAKPTAVDGEILSMAIAAPHVCDDITCPGHITQMKLILYELMITQLKAAAERLDHPVVKALDNTMQFSKEVLEMRLTVRSAERLLEFEKTKCG